MKGSISSLEARQLDDKSLIQGIHADTTCRTLWNELFQRANMRLGIFARRMQEPGYPHGDAMADAMKSLHRRVLGAKDLKHPSLGSATGEGSGLLRLVRLDLLEARAKALYGNSGTLPREMVRKAALISDLRRTGMTHPEIAEACGLTDEAVRCFFRMHQIVNGKDAEKAMEQALADDPADTCEDFDPSVILSHFLDPRSVSVLVARFDNEDTSDADIAAKLGIPRRTVARVRAQATAALAKVRPQLEAALFGWNDAA